MSIAAANLFTRSIYREFFNPNATSAQETRVARLASLVMKVGALGFALELNKTFSINLQLLGGIWILQTFPAIVIGLYTKWFHRFALIIGWLAGMAYGTVQAYRTPGGGQLHFGASTTPVFGHIVYIAVAALAINLIVAVVLTPICRAAKMPNGYDETEPAVPLAVLADRAAVAEEMPAEGEEPAVAEEMPAAGEEMPAVAEELPAVLAEFPEPVTEPPAGPGNGDRPSEAVRAGRERNLS
jgi:SSS family solute:Na+ symporter